MNFFVFSTLELIGTMELEALRKELHAHPELSGKEEKTAQKIVDFLSNYEPDNLITNIGGYGLIAVYEGKEAGPTIAFRCELDGLPVSEINEFDHKSKFKDLGHMCGHDGHMAMVAGLAPFIKKNSLKRGKVILIFQPAEETGKGAFAMIDDEKFKNFSPDYIFATHNLPGFPFGEVVLKENVFAAASKGMIVKYKGKTSHAAEPENGINPYKAVASLLEAVPSIPNSMEFSDLVLVTPVYAHLGEDQPYFGVNPGNASVMFTLRTYFNEDMDLLEKRAVSAAEKIAKAEGLKLEISWDEAFEATTNDTESLEVVRKAAENTGVQYSSIHQPFKWSEDFGYFTNRFKGAIFGLGAGENHPDLHNPDYDFPDKLIEKGVAIYKAIIKEFKLL